MIELLQHFLTRRAQHAPERVAIVHPTSQMTYGQLEADSNRLARLLQDAGCQSGDRVCLALPKSPTAIVAMLATLKADCVYVPLDPASPAPRSGLIVDSCEPRLILADTSTRSLLDQLTAEPARASIGIGWLGNGPAGGAHFQPRFSLADAAAYPDSEPEYGHGGKDVAHILFTSGSTGVPKGVMITHNSVIRFIEWATDYFQLDSSDRISAHPPLHFDLSTFDIYGALSSGAQLHLVPPELNLLPRRLLEFMRQSELTQWFSVPSVLSFLCTADALEHCDLPRLKRLLWCGEVLRTPTLIHLMKRLPHVRFTNLYGPTEATVASSYYTPTECPQDASASIPIGSACKGEQLLLLDADLNPLPPGQTGDLYIGGAGLSPGYWRDEIRTDSAFIRRPGQFPERIYRTGDRGKLGPDGLYYYLGRADSQIKSRGYRIELGEIEVALSALSLTAECAIVAIATDGFESVAICCPYTVLAGIDSSPARLRTELRKVLPGYMLPTHWESRPCLPKNANGKIDRPALRKAFEQSARAAAGVHREVP